MPVDPFSFWPYLAGNEDLLTSSDSTVRLVALASARQNAIEEISNCGFSLQRKRELISNVLAAWSSITLDLTMAELELKQQTQKGLST